MADIYRKILEDFGQNCRRRGGKALLMNYSISFTPDDIMYDKEIEKYIYINKEKKLKYIEKNYWRFDKNNFIINAKKRCIESIKIENNAFNIHLRSSRLFPTLYLDLLMIKHKCQQYNIKTINLSFDKIFIMKESFIIRKFFTGLLNDNFVDVARKWENYILYKPLVYRQNIQFRDFLINNKLLSITNH